MDKKLDQAINNLEIAIKESDQLASPVIANASISKCFEVALEYAWKFFKRRIESDGMEIYTPKDAIRAAASIGLIDNPELWISFIDNRNLSVHDYLGIEDKEYLESIKVFLRECKRLRAKW